MTSDDPPPQRRTTELPALTAVPELSAALAAAGTAVLVAPPGTGKTTGVPAALAGRSGPRKGRIVVAVPRRMAARAAAARMAATAGESVGGTFGYSVRDDRRVSRRTTVEVVTPGLLLRRVQADPALSGTATVIVDEFHERSIDQDLLLALLVDIRSALREDLEILVMSATLDAAALARLLSIDGPATNRSATGSAPAGTPVVEVASPLHPVETFWRAGSIHDRISDRVADVIVEALNAHDGDLLAFVPGRGEIRSTARSLNQRLVGTDRVAGSTRAATTHRIPEVLELHGSLPPEAQDAVLAPDPAGPRRVILSTAVAETSLTVPGVRIVVDSGLRRYQSVDPGNGLPSLRTATVSIATADQRRGRAGREAPGHCYRLWGRNEEELMRAHDPPEILVGDLSGLLLTTSTWGASSPQELRWLDAPPTDSVDRARQLLGELGALDADDRPTELGRRMTAFGYHPRIAAIAVAAVDRGELDLAARTLAVLDDPPRGTSDLVELVLANRSGSEPRGSERSVKRWKQRLRAVGPPTGRSDAGSRTRGRGGSGSSMSPPTSSEAGDPETMVGEIVLAGYADRIARRRSGRDDTYLMRHGGEVALQRRDGQLGDAEWLVVLDLDARTDSAGAGRIHLAVPLAEPVVQRLLAEADSSGGIQMEVAHSWDPGDGSVATTIRRRLGAITLDSQRRRSVPMDGLIEAVTAVVTSRGPEVFASWGSLDRLRERVAFVASHGIARPVASGVAPRTEVERNWPDLSEKAVASRCAEWVPALATSAARSSPGGEVTAFSPDSRMLEAALLAELDHHDRVTLARAAPTHWEHPGGRRFGLRYGEIDGDPSSVLLAVRLQELIGVDEHPSVGGIPVTVELLSPAGRPLQRTLDLPGFWRGSYAQVRAEMRGRYPKHDWPERPWEP